MKRAAILDRDGVINRNERPVNRPDELVLFPRAAEAIRLLNGAGFLVCVATNQGGVGLGYMSEADLKAVHRRMCELLAREGARVDDIVACTHRPDAGCPCRKPKPGMLFALARRHDLHLAASYMVGDRDTDVQAGLAAGTKTVFIGTGPSEAHYEARDLLDAAEWIVRDGGGSGLPRQDP
ncbi:D-glycero-alpha-D-manno-heptose-1,7-bisphosphate 7-phosphatase [Alicyclobacillus macrosporangiidus]|uniref:D,D-heptose 1,7-bisphosphate phosphatase n=1 Tax=Alicyclobacillus macrosporangiidus TaxID=392015 RepID=A0A1I7JBB8_9BACL|nr:HAD family hydrolase [Alicyclobacillus macrosporangiidus]SFU82507.1 D-glycero-D-manno-heptose 1,7-bisphosphate phosphatase [Alicyclobacillus macrosporangiidus]